MGTVRRYLPGTPSWVDVATTDAADAKRFYGGLFGWEAVDQPAGEGMIYTGFQKDGHDVAGMFQLSPDMVQAGVPANWQTYISVADVDRMAARAVELGAEVLNGPMDAMEAGRMVTLRDPGGAVFSLWQANQHIGCGVVNEPGALVWNELVTRDVPAARKFYEALFGWQGSADDRGYVSYLNRVGDEQVYAGGIFPMALAEYPPEVPPHWVPYFAVADVGAARQRVVELGGQAITEVMDIDQGKFCVVADRQGASFYLFEMSSGDTGDSSDKLP